MDTLRLEGLFSKEAEVDREDYYQFELDSMDLNVLARFIRNHLGIADTCRVQIGQGTICFQAVSQNSFGAEFTGDNGVLLRASPGNLDQLASRLLEMARVESDPDYLVHVHLDTYFTTPGEGLSDIVFQRLDEYHQGM